MKKIIFTSAVIVSASVSLAHAAQVLPSVEINLNALDALERSAMPVYSEPLPMPGRRPVRNPQTAMRWVKGPEGKPVAAHDEPAPVYKKEKPAPVVKAEDTHAIEEAKKAEVKKVLNEEAAAAKEDKLAQLKAEKDEKLAQLQHEKEEKLAKIHAEKEAKEAKIKADKEAKLAKIQADKEAKEAKKQAEKEAKLAKAEAKNTNNNKLEAALLPHITENAPKLPEVVENIQPPAPPPPPPLPPVIPEVSGEKHLETAKIEAPVVPPAPIAPPAEVQPTPQPLPVVEEKSWKDKILGKIGMGKEEKHAEVAPPSVPPAPPGEKPDVKTEELPKLPTLPTESRVNENSKIDTQEPVALPKDLKNEGDKLAELPKLPTLPPISGGPALTPPVDTSAELPKLPKLPDINPGKVDAKVDSPKELPPLPELPKALPPIQQPVTAEKKDLPELPKLPSINKPEASGKIAEQQVAAATPAPVSGVTSASLSVPFVETETEIPLAVHAQLMEFAQKANRAGGEKISVIAYASGTAEQASAARRVSLHRALAIRSFLIEKGGIDSNRVNVQSMGNRNNSGGAPDRVDIMLGQKG